ncbi:interferon-inducible GTPase-domain-containing protein [Suillus occidentalis]|nr:interferon-inducible GTPase-domain-containing protein [Suillus occidentalis]
MGVWFSRLWPEEPNPSFVEIEARQRAEAAAEHARRDVEAAEAELKRAIQEHQKSHEKAMEDQLAATQAAQAQAFEEMMATMQAERAANEIAREQAHKEMMEMVQAERAANEARFRAETAAHAANEEAKQTAAEAEEERKRTTVARERDNNHAQAVQEQAKKMEEAAEEEKRKAIAAKEAANALKKAAVEELERARAVREEAERKLAEGIQPLVTPTPEEVRTNKLLARYHEDLFHIAVAGAAGGGKSSLINAFRGLHNKDIGSAATGITETTMDITRYPDPNAEYPYVWYDVPGAGTPKIPEWQYFNTQGLYIYDCIIVLFDNRFTMTDIAILTNCRRFKIPTYIVRSKADQHIHNIMKDMGYDSDDDESEVQKKRYYHVARQELIEQTRQSVKDNLEDANIPDQKVYIVSHEAMLGVVKAKRPKKVIDEIELLNDLIWEAQTRRLGRREVHVATVVKDMLQSLTAITGS